LRGGTGKGERRKPLSGQLDKLRRLGGKGKKGSPLCVGKGGPTAGGEKQWEHMQVEREEKGDLYDFAKRKEFFLGNQGEILEEGPRQLRE